MAFYNKLPLMEELPHDKILLSVSKEEKLVQTIINQYKAVVERDPSCTQFRLIVLSKQFKAKLQEIIDKIMNN